jgi:hypothetical protein
MQHLPRSGTRRTVNVAVAEVAPIQQLDNALQVSVTHSPWDLRRHGADLFELGVGEGDRRHFLNPPGWKSGARAGFWKGASIRIFNAWGGGRSYLRLEPLAVRRRLLARLVRKRSGLVLNAQFEQDGPLLFKHACALGCEGIVSKRKRSRYRSGRSRDWVKSKNPAAPAVKREEEEDWGREGGDDRPPHADRLRPACADLHPIGGGLTVAGKAF